MARLNIEDCWWTDPRRSALAKLVGDEALADGLAVKMWRLAQEYWGRSRGLIPREMFDTIPEASKLIQAKLAREEGDQIYVRGSSQYLDWICERRAAGRVGGIKSAQKRQAKSKQNPSKLEQTQPSYSYSSSKEENIYLSLPLLTQEKLRAKYDASFLNEGLSEAVIYHSANPASSGWPPMVWGQRIVTWLAEKKRRIDLDVKARERQPDGNPLTGGWEHTDGVS